MPQSDCLIDGDRGERAAVADGYVERERAGRAEQRQVALHAEAAAVGRRLHRVERNVMAWRFSTSSSMVSSMSALSSSPSACMPPVPSMHAQRTAIDVELEARPPSRRPRALRLPGGHVDQEIVPGLGGRAGALGAHRQRAVSGPSTYLPAEIGTRRAYNARGWLIHPPRRRTTPMAVELDHSFTTARSLDDSYATILDLERWSRASRERACSSAPARSRSRPRSRSRWARCR